MDITGQATINDIDADSHYGDIRRIYTPGGQKIIGQATLNDVDADSHYGDIRRIYTPGGQKIIGQATLNDVDADSHYGDIKRIYTPDGQKITGQAALNDVDETAHYGDILRIAFVTLKDMLDSLATNIKVLQPYGIPWLDNQVCTSAWCWRIARQDGVVMGFTSYDQDITFNGVTYKACTGFAPTAVSTSNDMSVDNLDSEGILTDDGITAEDLRAGVYNNARIEIFLVNYKNLKDEVFMVRRGTIGEVKYGKNGFTAAIRGLMQAYQAKAGKTCQKGCRTFLGSTLCKIDLSAYTINGSVTTVNSAATFGTDTTQPDSYFDYGVITWLTGKNAGLSQDVKHSASIGTICLFMPMPFTPALGDTFKIVAGCDGNASTCKTRFGNLVNFRAEPYVMGNSYAVSYPSTGGDNIVSEGDDVRLGTYDWGGATTLWSGYISNKISHQETSTDEDGFDQSYTVTQLCITITKPSGLTYADDFFKGKTIQMASGEKKGSKFPITSYIAATGAITISSTGSFWRFQSGPVSKIAIGDKFRIS
jgi:uncharacterized phage protein (TIGR02218 family)